MKTWLAMILVLGACIDSTRRPTDAALDALPDASDTAEDALPDVPDPRDTLAESCDESGTTRCASDALATEVCIGGAWQRVPCEQDRICVTYGGAQCIATTGPESCRNTLYCVMGCELAYQDNPEARSACGFACAIKATRAAQTELQLYTGCLEAAGCGDEPDDAPSRSDGFACGAAACSQLLALCYFDTTGPDDCAAIVRCLVECRGAVSCEANCGTAAKPDAQGDFAVLDLCSRLACATASDSEACLREVTGVNGACAGYTAQCIGPF